MWGAERGRYTARPCPQCVFISFLVKRKKEKEQINALKRPTGGGHLDRNRISDFDLGSFNESVQHNCMHASADFHNTVVQFVF